jgi:hypothetical protein
MRDPCDVPSLLERTDAMTLIHVPRPPKNAYNPDRPISALLKQQVEHLYDAEKRLPSRYRSEIYVNAIKTEGEAASYIRAVTEAIHDAHADAARARRAPLRRRGLEIAAVADQPQKKRARTTKKKATRKAAKKKAGKKK